MKPENNVAVIAKDKEKISAWLAGLNPTIRPIVVQKDQHVPNVGGHVASYLWFIVSNFGIMAEADVDNFIFLPGNPLEYYPMFSVKRIDEVDYYGYDDLERYIALTENDSLKPDLDVSFLAVINTLNLPRQKEYLFKPGSMFKVPTSEIMEKPLSFYALALSLALNVGDDANWIFERLWPLIFPSLLAETDHDAR